MRKIDYSKIKWDATTNWEFCGSKENLKEIRDRYYKAVGVGYSVEEFGYRKPHPGLAFDKGDVVVEGEDRGHTRRTSWHSLGRRRASRSTSRSVRSRTRERA